MTNYYSDYENIDDILAKATESNYTKPIFDDHHETVPLIENSIEDDQSPYEEVAANISNKDDPTMLCLTIRSVFIGILLTCIMAFVFQFFAYRTSPIDFNVGIIILIAFLLGRLFAKILPKEICRIPFNPGPFSVKELTLITIMASSGSGTNSAMESLTILRLDYNYYLNHYSAVIYIILMHLIALSTAGILNRYLVWPGSMIWPRTLMSCGLIRTLDAEDETPIIKSRWTMKRSTLFWLLVLIQFIYYWLPGYIFPLLSFFSMICMIAPNKIIFSQITGANGLGVGAFEFDWNALVAYLDSPILVPFWAHINVFVGFVSVIWIITPCLYYLNVWDAQKMPIISLDLFNNDGYLYNTSKILNQKLRLNETAYHSYGQVHVTSGFIASYIFLLAAIPALIVHTILYHGPSIVEHFRSSISDKKNDIHARLISHYPQVHEWWYYILLLITFILGFVYCFLTELMPGYVLLFSILLNFIIMLPAGIIVAITNTSLSTIVISDLISSLFLPGDPIGYLAFRTYTYSCQGQIVMYLVIYKIAHYMKIPPRLTLPMLIICPIINSIISYITALFLMNNIPNICTGENLAWKCLNTEKSYMSSVTWGAIGSIRIFGPGSSYSPILYALIAGAILPIISWTFWKRYPNIKWLEFINFPIIFMSTCVIPPAPAAEYITWFIVGFLFNFILYRYAHAWWEKYAYIFSMAMSCGVVLCGICIFFGLENNNIQFPQWWGLGGPTGDGCPLASGNYSGVLPTFLEL